MGVSHEAQLRALKILDVVLRRDDGKQIFQFAYSTWVDKVEKMHS